MSVGVFVILEMVGPSFGFVRFVIPLMKTYHELSQVLTRYHTL